MVECRMPMTKTACGLILFLGVCVGQSFTINTVAGGGNPSTGNGDGGQATSAFLTPLGLTLDSAGNMRWAMEHWRPARISPHLPESPGGSNTQTKQHIAPPQSEWYQDP